MKSPRVLIGLVVVALALTGCGPGTPTGGGTTEPAPVETTDAPAVAAAVILSLDGIAVQDAAGTTLESSAFTDPDATLALLGSLLGSTPEPTEYPEFGSSTWEWDGLLFGRASDEFSWLRAETADIGGLPLQTAAGIQVGSSRGDVILQSPYDGNYDMDGDGESDLYGLEQRTNEEYESLEFPGLPGTEYIEVQLDGDVVSVLRAPSNDYSDV